MVPLHKKGNINDEPRTMEECSTTGEGASMESRSWHVEGHQVENSNVTTISGFNAPYALAFDELNRLYVPDLRDHRIVRFTKDLKFDFWLGFSKDEQISGFFDKSHSVDPFHNESIKGPHSVTFDLQGRIIVADYYNKSVNYYDSCGALLGYVNDSPIDTTLKFEAPANAHMDSGGNLWVSDWISHRIFKLDSELNLIGWLGATDSGPTNGFNLSGQAIHSRALGGFNKPHMLKVDANGFLYIVDTWNHRIQKFTSDGQALGWIGAKETGGVTNGFELEGNSVQSSSLGGFAHPISISISEDQTLIIADNTNNRIQSFDLEGKYLGWIGGSQSKVYTSWTTDDVSAISGIDVGYFLKPFDAILSNGKLYVADGHNRRVVVYDEF